MIVEETRVGGGARAPLDPPVDSPLVRMKLDGARFRAYSGGIFTGPYGNNLHTMLVVSYAETVKGDKF